MSRVSFMPHGHTCAYIICYIIVLTPGPKTTKKQQPINLNNNNFYNQWLYNSYCINTVKIVCVFFNYNCRYLLTSQTKHCTTKVCRVSIVSQLINFVIFLSIKQSLCIVLYKQSLGSIPIKFIYLHIQTIILWYTNNH